MQSKSVSELAKITSLGDFPMPKMGGRKKKEAPGEEESSRPISRASVKEGLYGTLPKSMKAEVGCYWKLLLMVMPL